MNRQPLIVFDLANNHQGDLELGLKIIRELSKVCSRFPFRCGLKLQYRHLDSLLHPHYSQRQDVPYIKRFLSTSLGWESLRQLKEEAQHCGFTTVCTPFDERSVELAEEHEFKIIKIASCSILDWQLLERIALTEQPLIASTAGVSLENLDRVVTFFRNRDKQLTLLHCVAEYPTQPKRLRLHRFDLLRERYAGIPIGVSLHTPGDDSCSTPMLIAKQAAVIERHVGLSSCNTYSSTPEQIALWLDDLLYAVEIEGSEQCNVSSPQELASLRQLGRAAFARRDIQQGEQITGSDVLLAMPAVDDLQLTAADISKYRQHTAKQNISALEPLLPSNVVSESIAERLIKIGRQVKGLLKRSGVTVPNQVQLEISHHYGLDRFDQWGVSSLTAVNRSYCKKLLILLPGQQHPEQYHREKEESFHVLYGILHLSLDGSLRDYGPGDVVVVEPGVLHAFSTGGGVVLEEVSTTHKPEDSYYTDPAIAANSHRKTSISYWLG